MEWVTYDENGKEHLTKVHEVECVKQVFSIKTGQFMCTCDKKYCDEKQKIDIIYKNENINEICKNYSGLEKLMEF